MQSLRILFGLGCSFKHVPPVVGALPSLYMLSFKSNQLTTIAEGALAPSLQWLILTDNQLTVLPRTLWSCRDSPWRLVSAGETSALLAFWGGQGRHSASKSESCVSYAPGPGVEKGAGGAKRLWKLAWPSHAMPPVTADLEMRPTLEASSWYDEKVSFDSLAPSA